MNCKIVSFVLCSLTMMFQFGCSQGRSEQGIEESGQLIAILHNYEKDTIVASNQHLDRFFYTIQFVQSDSCVFMNLIGDDFAPIFFVMNSSDAEEIEYYKKHGYSNNHLYGYIELGDDRMLFIHEGNGVDSLVRKLLPNAVIKHDEEYQVFVCFDLLCDNPTYQYTIDDSLRISLINRCYY